ncbi:hypothetical protein BDN70DRAFT_885977 [Pholiota conissans]|uniref:Alpha-type protein kinase domain-containing protein n=1 Tax=Pholiota conissans TaxID=109636 RepID=A0A9P5YPY3_9AGAR|nr:hypothetical protein BDN70DRAFT_885977 [Pholiota conissans]
MPYCVLVPPCTEFVQSSLNEPKRPSTVMKFSGMLKHQASRKDILVLTVYALAHYVYLTSNGTRVLADIQGTGTHINGKDIMVLFDVMMHSTDGDIGIGDYGAEAGTRQEDNCSTC